MISIYEQIMSVAKGKSILNKYFFQLLF